MNQTTETGAEISLRRRARNLLSEKNKLYREDEMDRLDSLRERQS